VHGFEGFDLADVAEVAPGAPPSVASSGWRCARPSRRCATAPRWAARRQRRGRPRPASGTRTRPLPVRNSRAGSRRWAGVSRGRAAMAWWGERSRPWRRPRATSLRRTAPPSGRAGPQAVPGRGRPGWRAAGRRPGPVPPPRGPAGGWRPDAESAGADAQRLRCPGKDAGGQRRRRASGPAPRRSAGVGCRRGTARAARRRHQPVVPTGSAGPRQSRRAGGRHGWFVSRPGPPGRAGAAAPGRRGCRWRRSCRP